MGKQCVLHPGKEVLGDYLLAGTRGKRLDDAGLPRAGDGVLAVEAKLAIVRGVLVLEVDDVLAVGAKLVQKVSDARDDRLARGPQQGARGVDKSKSMSATTRSLPAIARSFSSGA